MLNVILNENAAGKTAGKKFEAVAKIFESHKAEYRVYRTEYRRHATEIAANLRCRAQTTWWWPAGTER